MNDVSGVIKTLPRTKELIDGLLLLLSQKEKYVIEKRFSLDQNEKSTLEEIGKKFEVTRERVRQIEKNALTKLRRNVNNTDLVHINDFAKLVLKRSGGVMREEALISNVINEIGSKDEEINVHALKLSLHLDKELYRRPNTIMYNPYVRFATITDELIGLIANKGIQVLQAKGDVITRSKLVSDIVKSLGKDRGNFSPEFIIASLLVHKRIKDVDNGIGLVEWRHINPRTLRDKIQYILSQYKKPLHFVDIANKITDGAFDKKSVNVQAVHNELIRSDQFVLIGRGIYALQEWGYKPGTVADVIQSILKDKGELSQDEIIDEVLKQRQVKKITIVLNLKNNEAFERVGRNRYKLT